MPNELAEPTAVTKNWVLLNDSLSKLVPNTFLLSQKCNRIVNYVIVEFSKLLSMPLFYISQLHRLLESILMQGF